MSHIDTSPLSPQDEAMYDQMEREHDEWMAQVRDFDTQMTKLLGAVKRIVDNGELADSDVYLDAGSTQELKEATEYLKRAVFHVENLLP